MDNPEILKRFSTHKPSTVEVSEAHGRLYQEFRIFAGFVDHLLPESREKSVALTKLEEALFWSNAAVARNEKGSV